MKLVDSAPVVIRFYAVAGDMIALIPIDQVRCVVKEK